MSLPKVRASYVTLAGAGFTEVTAVRTNDAYF